MGGMNAYTGRKISDAAHLAQSILDILTTPIGSRVMRRDYGSRLPDIIDQPLNDDTVIDAYQAVAEALAAWEPRVTLARIQLVSAASGRAVFDLTDADGRIIQIETGGAA